jgi:hypothetical protein
VKTDIDKNRLFTVSQSLLGSWDSSFPGPSHGRSLLKQTLYPHNPSQQPIGFSQPTLPAPYVSVGIDATAGLATTVVRVPPQDILLPMMVRQAFQSIGLGARSSKIVIIRTRLFSWVTRTRVLKVDLHRYRRGRLGFLMKRGYRVPVLE